MNRFWKVLLTREGEERREGESGGGCLDWFEGHEARREREGKGKSTEFSPSRFLTEEAEGKKGRG